MTKPREAEQTRTRHYAASVGLKSKFVRSRCFRCYLTDYFYSFAWCISSYTWLQRKLAQVVKLVKKKEMQCAKLLKKRLIAKCESGVRVSVFSKEFGMAKSTISTVPKKQTPAKSK